MKVGTDGVLLGAWTPIPEHAHSILDIGAGSGVIALMLAQRSNAEQVDALEIDDDAYEQAVENFEDSPWSDRLFCFHAGLDEFIDEPEDEYDLIVSNPPYHTEEYFSADEKRNVARFVDSLPFETLVEAAALLLSETGIFSVIIPYKAEPAFLALAEAQNLFPIRITRVKGVAHAEIKRSLIAFSRTHAEPEINELVIEISRHNYTADYIALTREFYLNM
ncbi:MAG: methyltransferase domain-containing protein [Flavobacterium sp.]|nr:MAG: methyltransferase domain-containing protein [Flavobacterium sp.]